MNNSQSRAQPGAPHARAGHAALPDAPRPAASTKRPSLAFLVSHSSAGGAQEIWANLAEAFLDRGYPVQLCALYPYRAEIRETAEALPWRYMLPYRPGSPLGLIRLLVGLARYLRRERPDFVFSAMPAANVLGPLVGKLVGAPTRFVTSHHSPAQTHSRLIDFADGLTGSFANVQAVVSVSQAVGDSLAHKPAAYRAKRSTIHNALPPRIESRIEVLAQARMSGRKSGRRLVATGRLARQKNYPMLLKAAVLLDDVMIDIVGSGPDEAELKAMAVSLGVSERVLFHGQCSRERALNILAEGDVFVQPSLFEGHSLGLIEAAKLGLPLVVSNVPVQLEGITSHDGRRCGLAVDPHDHEGFAAAVRSLLDDETERGLWAGRARALAASATFDRMVAAYEALMGPRK